MSDGVEWKLRIRKMMGKERNSTKADVRCIRARPGGDRQRVHSYGHCHCINQLKALLWNLMGLQSLSPKTHCRRCVAFVNLQDIVLEIQCALVNMSRKSLLSSKWMGPSGAEAFTSVGPVFYALSKNHRFPGSV